MGKDGMGSLRDYLSCIWFIEIQWVVRSIRIVNLKVKLRAAAAFT